MFRCGYHRMCHQAAETVVNFSFLLAIHFISMKTILLIDDDENIRSTFSLALRHHDYRVIEAGSGTEGLQLARKHLPDLILSDISMPGMGGQDVLKSIRETPELSGKQVVLMTGQTHLVTPRKGMALGADDF